MAANPEIQPTVDRTTEVTENTQVEIPCLLTEAVEVIARVADHPGIWVGTKQLYLAKIVRWGKDILKKSPPTTSSQPQP